MGKNTRLEDLTAALSFALDLGVRSSKGSGAGVVEEHNLIMDNSGSYLPVIWGSYVLKSAHGWVFKNEPNDYLYPIVSTAIMLGVEMSQKLAHWGGYDKKDICAGIIGGISAATIARISSHTRKKRALDLGE